MKKFAAKISMGLAAAALAATLFAPSAFAANKVVVKGNGAHSDTDVTLKNKNTTSVTQTNSTAVFTFVLNGSNTGGNKVKNNTGAGDSSVVTGDVTNKTKITVTGNSNTAAAPAPCGCDTDTTVVVKNNGAHSDNDVKVVNSNSTTVSQTNETVVGTAVVNLSNTGDNTVSGNTGAGDHNVTTGDVKNKTTVDVTGGTNTL